MDTNKLPQKRPLTQEHEEEANQHAAAVTSNKHSKTKQVHDTNTIASHDVTAEGIQNMADTSSSEQGHEGEGYN